jgi:hypothetical protein
MWPQLESAVDEAVRNAAPSREPQRSQEDKLAELIDTVRRLERGLDTLTWAALTLGVQPASMQPAEQEVIRPAAALYEQLHSSEPREAWLKAALFTINAFVHQCRPHRRSRLNRQRMSKQTIAQATNKSPNGSGAA